jgi:hypothetical protein
MRHEQPSEEGDEWHRQELEELIEGISAAATAARHELGDIGIDRYQLDPDADPGDKAPQIDAEVRGLKRHDRGCDRIPDQREGEDRAASIAIGEMAEKDRAIK